MGYYQKRNQIVQLFSVSVKYSLALLGVSALNSILILKIAQLHYQVYLPSVDLSTKDFSICKYIHKQVNDNLPSC